MPHLRALNMNLSSAIPYRQIFMMYCVLISFWGGVSAHAQTQTSVPVSFTLAPRPACTSTIRKTKDLNFGKWKLSGRGEERWSVKIHPPTAPFFEFVTETNVDDVFVNPITATAGTVEVRHSNCGTCTVTPTSPETLGGTSEGGTIDFELDPWELDNEGEYTFLFGGTISGLISETPADTYTGTVTALIACVP